MYKPPHPWRLVSFRQIVIDRYRTLEKPRKIFYTPMTAQSNHEQDGSTDYTTSQTQ
jgi:hypothetical protein